MEELKLTISIIRRDQSEEYIDFYKENNIGTFWSSLCDGTASKTVLDYLGMEYREKAVMYSVATKSNAKKLMRDLIYKMNIDVPGNGIAMTVPLGSVGGVSSLNYLTKGQNIEIEEEKSENMNALNETQEIQYSLITAIAEKGCIDIVMDAARSAGAKGGTVIHAKGTGADFTQKFFGISIASEKEMIYIVTKRKDRDAIMQAIMEKAGPDTDAHAAVFSLPVENVVGLRSVAEDAD